MRYIFLMFAVFVIGLNILTGCSGTTQSVKTEPANNAAVKSQPSPNSPAVKTDAPEGEAPRITLAEAKKDFDAGNVVFVDTRSEASYRQEHIKGAISIPAEAMKTRYKEIPTGKKIIAYCS